ncbi:YceI family protein [Acidiphilium acidophilum]|uniref:YceI family protein n=1 Tax=Acidiphilium acidophilum TaxID=76588 RepID=UPI002E8E70BF|nr:YceI family protein [Acidiphilium acidophilum]
MKTGSAILMMAGLLVMPILARAGAPSWTVDAAKSSITFTGTQTGTAFHGGFKKFTARIAFSPNDVPASHVDVTVDLASAYAGNAQRNAALPGSDWFNVAKTPQAVFTSTHITQSGPHAYQAQGTLQLRGVTKPLTLPFTIAITGTTAQAVGHATILRTAFGVGQGPWQSGQYVGLHVAVTVTIVAHQTP